MKTAKQLERYFKGLANHWRTKILLLVSRQPEITLDQIVKELGGNTKTISEHTRRLVHSGLLNKKYRGSSVIHTLSPYGEKALTFLSAFQ